MRYVLWTNFFHWNFNLWLIALKIMSFTNSVLCQAARSLKAFSLLSFSLLVSWLYFADWIAAFTGKQWPLSLGLLPHLPTNFVEISRKVINHLNTFPCCWVVVFMLIFVLAGRCEYFQWYLFQINLNETTNDWEWKENNVMDCVERILSLTIVIMVLRIRQFKAYGPRYMEYAWTNERTNEQMTATNKYKLNWITYTQWIIDWFTSICVRFGDMNRQSGLHSGYMKQRKTFPI